MLAIDGRKVEYLPLEEGPLPRALRGNRVHVGADFQKMRVDLSGHSFIFPASCACCNGAADQHLTIWASRSSGKRVIRTAANAWDVPYCSGCLAHVSAAESARSLAKVLTLASLAGGALLWFTVDQTIGLIVAILGLAGTVFLHSRQVANAKAGCCADCACVHRAIAYLGWHGTLHQFEVMSPRFAADLMAANARKLVNLSREARDILESRTATASPNAPRAPRRYRS